MLRSATIEDVANLAGDLNLAAAGYEAPISMSLEKTSDVKQISVEALTAMQGLAKLDLWQPKSPAARRQANPQEGVRRALVGRRRRGGIGSGREAS